MSDAATRLELLRLTKPEGISMPDLAMWIGRAKELEAWVNESAGQAEAPDMRSLERRRQRPDKGQVSPAQ